MIRNVQRRAERGRVLVNIVFCISKGNHNHKRIEDEFSFNAVTQVFGYNDSAELLDRFLSGMGGAAGFRIQPKLQLVYNGDIKIIDLKRISYIKIAGRIVEVHVTDNRNSSYQAYAKLSDLERCLKKLGFIRVHRSYIVPVNKIDTVRKHYIVMGKGKIINIGRKFKHNIAAMLSDEKAIVNTAKHDI